ncbi:MAG: hypothetical protein EA403_00130 [Spirochaetaceae bacterium]|nr:MAG: hypothetical protein EA403_00130 [Spirochaetaceae bacterium]
MSSQVVQSGGSLSGTAVFTVDGQPDSPFTIASGRVEGVSFAAIVRSNVDSSILIALSGTKEGAVLRGTWMDTQSPQRSGTFWMTRSQ